MCAGPALRAPIGEVNLSSDKIRPANMLRDRSGRCKYGHASEAIAGLSVALVPVGVPKDHLVAMEIQ